MRETFARVLAGEIRKPGSFSLATLQFMAVLDGKTAQAVQTIAPFVMVGRAVPIPGAVQERIGFETMLLLNEVGFVRGTGAAFDLINWTFTINLTGAHAMLFGRRCVVMYGNAGQEVKIPMVPLTNIGLEVYSMLSVSDDISFIEEVCRAIPKQGMNRMSIARRQRLAGEVIAVDERTVCASETA